MRKPVITFDCDGVFADFTKMFTGLVNSKFGTEYTPEWPAYDAAAIMSREHWDSGWELVKATPYFWMLLESYPDVPFKKLGAMLFEGVFTSYVVSLRVVGDDVDPALQTRLWLNDKGLTHLQGVIVGNQNRPALLTMLGSDAHLDDSGAHVVDLRKAGINAYLLDRTWNQDAAVDPAYRVYSIDQFLEDVVSTFLPAEVNKTFFSPPQIADLVTLPNLWSAEQSAHLLRESGFQFYKLAEASRA